MENTKNRIFFQLNIKMLALFVKFTIENVKVDVKM